MVAEDEDAIEYARKLILSKVLHIICSCMHGKKTVMLCIAAVTSKPGIMCLMIRCQSSHPW